MPWPIDLVPLNNLVWLIKQADDGDWIRHTGGCLSVSPAKRTYYQHFFKNYPVVIQATTGGSREEVLNTTFRFMITNGSLPSGLQRQDGYPIDQVDWKGDAVSM